VVVPEHICYHLPDGLSYEEAAMTEPTAVAAHAFRLTPAGLNDSVAIVGSGLIGLLLLDIVKASVSGKVFALDTDENRRKVALARGADAVFDPMDPDLGKKILDLTAGRGVDRVFEAVGATAPIQTALSIVRKGGSVVLIGNLSAKIELPLQRVVTGQISLVGSCAIGGEYPIVLDMMVRRKIDVASLISKKAPLSEGHAWIDKLSKREDNLLKVALIP
jgi:(R,R)-butanediol dehydrogenase/meso-butanediol dehydrogenase/diacetyl reductase/L-iditol 2-dehydrogenase